MDRMSTRQEVVVVEPQAGIHIPIGDISNLRPIMERYFTARRVEIVAPEEASVKIAGKPAAVNGVEIMAENTDNPEPITIKIEANRGDLKSQDGSTMVLARGVIEISGIKNFDPEDALKSRKELEELPPVRDPDVVRVDNQEYLQTGTIRVTIERGARIKLTQ